MSHAKQAAAEKRKVGIFVVDDHPVVRQGIRMLVGQEPDLTVCGDADNASDALTAIEHLKPNLAIVDLSLKSGSGMELIKDLQIRCPKVSILVLSMHDESFYAERALRAGAKGYVNKAEGPEKVIEGIRRILRGEVFLSEKVVSRMLSRLADGRTANAANLAECLTDRELQVFELIGTGKGAQEIAVQLHLSVKTIETHREHIKQKLKLEGSKDLLKLAIQWVQSEKKI